MEFHKKSIHTKLFERWFLLFTLFSFAHWDFCKCRLSLLGFIPSAAKIIEQKLHRGRTFSFTSVLVYPKFTYSREYFLDFIFSTTIACVLIDASLLAETCWSWTRCSIHICMRRGRDICSEQIGTFREAAIISFRLAIT